jgi:hypothetical protein
LNTFDKSFLTPCWPGTARENERIDRRLIWSQSHLSRQANQLLPHCTLDGKPAKNQPIAAFPTSIVLPDSLSSYVLPKWARHGSVKQSERYALYSTLQKHACSCVLIHQPDKSFVLLVGHRSIADGMSFVFLLRDLLSANSGQSLKLYAFPLSIDEIMGVMKRVTEEPGVSFSCELANQCVLRSLHVNSPFIERQ